MRKQRDYTDEALQDRWQEVFDPDNARGEAVRCHYAVTSQERERAVTHGRELLQTYGDVVARPRMVLLNAYPR